MKKSLLVSVITLAMFTTAFAISSISNNLTGDLYFNDEVKITSGVKYQSDIDEDTGSATVAFEGDGSLTIGRRLGQGFPRVVIYSGTTLTVAQDFSNKSSSEKNWWSGVVKAPVQVLNIPESLFTWENSSNHMVGETKVSVSYGFESASETYKFSNTAYIVLPVNAPDNAKIWYAFHDIDPDNFAGAEPVEIKENNFCIVQDNLCVIPVTEMNQVALIEESFERCPRSTVPNGTVGSIPYCVITCNRGYELDDLAIACTESDSMDTNNQEENEPVINNNEESTLESGYQGNSFEGLTGEELEKAIEEARLRSLGKKSYHSGHYRGESLQLIDTTDLSGDDLRNALRYNAEVNHRRGIENKRVNTDDSDVSFLAKALNDIRGTLWSWETQHSGKNLATSMTTGETGEQVGEASQELELAGNEGDENLAEVESFSGHASAPLLPSSGSSTIFIIISILGIGLMIMALKRN